MLKAKAQTVGATTKVVTSKVQYSTIESDLIVARVAQTAGIKESNVRNALRGITEAIRYFVINGHSVDLGKFGNLRLSVNASSVAKASQVSSDLVQSIGFNYTPSTSIKNELANISFKS